MTSDDLTATTLTQAATRLRNREIGSVELVAACLARVDRYNDVLRAFLHRRDAAAIATAEAADQAFSVAPSVPIGVLTGVPLAHKDMFHRAGEYVTYGAHPRRGAWPTITSTIKCRLDRLLVPDLGGLNMSEYAAGPTGVNPHYGRCTNPWNTERLSGGSSSGSAAAVAARLVFGSIGSDTGGSIRIPAALCGVTGLKPTHGRVSRYGALPRVWSQDVIGPIARSAEDCAEILSAICGPDGFDPLLVVQAPPFVWPPSPGGHVRIGVLHMRDEADRTVESCVDAAVVALAQLGHQVRTVEWNSLDDTLTLAETMHKAEASALHATLLHDHGEDYGDFVRERLEDGLLIPAVRYLQARALRAPTARAFVHSTMSDIDVVVLPTVGCEAPLTSAQGDDTTQNRAILRKLTRLTRPFSYLGLPALSVPCGFGAQGMPIGLQMVGRPFAEATILRVAHDYQQVTDWHLRSPLT